MENFKIALKQCLEHNNYYGALFIALSLPDICGKLEHPDRTSSSRYVAWFDKYIREKYIGGPNNDIFLTGSDCYALRCSLLHEGRDDISEQKIQETLEKFKFVSLPQGNIIHNNRVGEMLQLQVDIFCNDILEGIENWEEHIKDNKQIQEKMTNLLIITFPEENGSIRI